MADDPWNVTPRLPEKLHPHRHHIVTPGFVDRPRRRACTAGQMDGEAGWWTTSENIELPPLARVKGVGRQQHMIWVERCSVDNETSAQII